MVNELPGEKDGEIILIDKLMVGGTVFHKHNFWFLIKLQDIVSCMFITTLLSVLGNLFSSAENR